ncbi:MAG: flagellar motor protein MotB [Pseudomonadota bacterium]
MDKTKVRPIIVVKRRSNAAPHHGGAWKVAYADFVTAMMAFFMVMWLVTAATPEQRAAMFEYFKNPSMEEGHSVKAAPGQAGPGGASTAVINLHGGLDAAASSKDRGDSLAKAEPQASMEEKKQLESLMEELRKAIDKSQALQPFKDQLLLDITPEGLRIQIVDKLNRPMFDLGSSSLKDYTTTILHELAVYLNTVPNRISLSGHTDDKPYAGGRGYTNWELSADRANAARRALLEGGLDSAKVSRVVGLASAVLFNKQNPLDPVNRRISIIVMTKKAEAAALSTDAPATTPVPEASVTAPGSAAPDDAAAQPAATAPATVAAESPAAPSIASAAAPPAALPASVTARSQRESVAVAAGAAAAALARLKADQAPPQ